MTEVMKVEPVTLTGQWVRLEPLSEAHVPDLTVAGDSDDIWRYMLYGRVRDEAAMLNWVRTLLEWQRRDTDVPFAVIYLKTGRAVGATRYMDIRPAHRGLEIGGTWYSVNYQRTMVNTECKYLLMRHAFEVLKCIRVQLKTDLRNERSQRAIERIGAVREGVLRNHMITPEGYLRSSVMYSVIDSEWAEVKQRLEDKLQNLKSQ